VADPGFDLWGAWTLSTERGEGGGLDPLVER